MVRPVGVEEVEPQCCLFALNVAARFLLGSGLLTIRIRARAGVNRLHTVSADVVADIAQP